MDFSWSEEHDMVRRMVREFALREIAPTIKEHDREQTFDRSLLDKMAEQGLLGICLPVKYGGAGMDYISLGIACEELERVDTSARVIMSVHVGLNSLALFQWATEEQKQRYLVPQALGERIGTYALTGPTPAVTPPPSRRRRAKRGIPISSTAKRCGSRSPTWPIPSSSSPEPTPPRGIAAWRRSSSIAISPA